jgi:hypothetical protein
MLEFIAEWKPQIRPAGLLDTLPRSYRLATNERYDMMVFPRFLATYDRLWMREFRSQLESCSHIHSRLDATDLKILGRLLNTHRSVLRTTRYGEAYLGSIEDLSLFFLYHEIRPIWIIGCYDVVKNRLLDALETKALIFDPKETLALQKAVTTMTLIDCTQLQRVYNNYDHCLARELNSHRLASVDFGEAEVTPQRKFTNREPVAIGSPDKVPDWEELLRNV